MSAETSMQHPVAEQQPAPGARPIPVAWAPVARVELLPVEIVLNRQFRRTKQYLAAGVVLTALLAGAATVWMQTRVEKAEQELAVVQQETTRLRSEQSKYAEIPLILAQVDTAERIREQAMASDLPWYRYLNDLAIALPSQVWLTKVTGSVSPSYGVGAATDGALFDSLRVWENVAFRLVRGPKALPKTQAREVAVEKLRRVGLKPEVADLFPAELSGGMQKRVGLARAIAAEPEIIFFDEPTTGLDPIMSGVINDLIREIVVEMGATAMTITHDMSSVRAIADNPRTFRFASTAPFYVEIGGTKQHISRKSVQFFRDWVAERSARVPRKLSDAAQLNQVLHYHRAAEQYWQELAERSNAE